MTKNLDNKDDKTRDEILKKMLETPPTPNKPIKEKASDKGQRDRDPDDQ